MKSAHRILVADDELVARTSLAAWLREDGHEVDMAASGREAIALSAEREYEVCFLDLKMPGGPDGIESMTEIRRARPFASVVIMTAFGTIDTAVAAMREGAEDYIVKPFNLQEISILVERILHRRQVERDNAWLRKRLSGQYRFGDIVSKNHEMQAILELVREVAGLRSTVLIEGESGVGKELIARAIHYSGDRAEKPFVAVSCAALTDTLLESELFGHERGAFTGAIARRPGKFELAHEGTIFLDEIGEISPKLQMDLLRVLEQRRFFRVGGIEEIEVDVRFIAATNRDLPSSVAAGTFRDDLYYRLNVISMRLPPLRDRREDIPLLAAHFVEQLSAELGKKVEGIEEEALQRLLSRRWPGNVRELRNALERAIVTCRKPMLAFEDFAFLPPETDDDGDWAPPVDLPLAEVERRVIEAVLARTGGNVREAATVLGIDRSTLYDKIRRYGSRREGS